MTNRMANYDSEQANKESPDVMAATLRWDPESMARYLVVRMRDCAIYNGDGFTPLIQYRPEFSEVPLPMTPEHELEFNKHLGKMAMMEIPRRPPWPPNVVHALSNRPIGWFPTQKMAASYCIAATFNDPGTGFILIRVETKIKMRGNQIFSVDGSQSEFLDRAPAEELSASMKLRAELLKKAGRDKETDQFDEHDEKKEE